MKKYSSVLVAALMSVMFWSCSEDDPKSVLPTIALTVDASEITFNSAVLNGSVTLGTVETTISERGFYYSTTANPQEGGTKVPAAGTAAGSFSAPLSGLIQGTTYHYVAFITDDTGTILGEPKSFKTVALQGLSASWLFEDAANFTKATLGAPLEFVESDYVITPVAGPTADDKAIRIPMGSYLKAAHNLVPPAGADPQLVDEYTLVIDFKLPSDIPIDNFDEDHNDPKWWHALMQTDLTNLNDADLFINRSLAIGIGNPTSGLGYSSEVEKYFELDTWYRLVVSSSKVGDFYNFYVNGEEFYIRAKSQNGRQSLDPLGVLLFADETDEDQIIEVAAVSFWDRGLTGAEAAALGGF